MGSEGPKITSHLGAWSHGQARSQGPGRCATLVLVLTPEAPSPSLATCPGGWA